MTNLKASFIPGYGENIRVLQWIFERVEGKAPAVETPIGYVPTTDSINIIGLNGIAQKMPELLSIDKDRWANELKMVKEQYENFGDRLPSDLTKQVEKIESRLNN